MADAVKICPGIRDNRRVDRFAAMQAFARVVESGSFVRAAERLEMSTSSLSRLVADLESHLNARLLNRTTRKLSLTETGQAFYERCVQLLSDLDEAESFASRATAQAHGTIRLTCPHNLAAAPLAPAIASFIARHPAVKFDVNVSDRVVDLVEEGFDLAIRVGAVRGELLVARKLGATELVLCAAPAYLAAHGAPKVPADLARHQVMTYAYSPTPRVWQLRDADGRSHEVRVQGPLHANSGELAIGAAAAGLGIVFEPAYVVGPALADGRLVRLLQEFRGPTLDIWAVYPSRRHLSAKVRLFVAHLSEVFAAAPASSGSAASRPRRAGGRGRA
jgi:DNA-binding transcriptional LysR family regulator